MRIVVTGGAGFVGSHLCDRLLDEGHEVVCIDNLLTGTEENIAHLAAHDRFEFINYDVSQYVSVDGPVDAILHLASPASPEDYLNYPIQTLKVGALGTHNTLGLAVAKGARFLLASTSEIYGDPQIHPQPESYWGHVNPVGPRAVYDEAKRFAEAITMAYHHDKTHAVDTKIVRIFNTFGPRMRMDDGRALPNFFSQALADIPLTLYGDGSHTRTLCYVDDTVEGIYRLLLSEEHAPVNIGGTEEITILEMARAVIELVNSKSKIIHQELPEDDPKIRKPDLTKASKILDWMPKIPWQEGLQHTYDYFNKKKKEAGA